jgi:AraC-like DNA-binding protein
MGTAVASGWCTTSYEAKDQYEAWRQKLDAVYGSWALRRPTKPDLQAKILQHSVGNLRLVNCICDPCGAVRKRADGRDGQDMLAVQLVLSGREHFTIDSKNAVLGPGDILVWNTTRQMSFEIIDRLEKISVMMPLSRLRSWLPNSWHSIGCKLPSGSTAASLLSSFIQSVSPEFLSGNLRYGEALTEAMIGILINALGIDSAVVEPSTLRDVQLLRVTKYIDAHLDDPELSPSMIAAANGISVRYLHCLFEPEGTTVLQYVIKERLVRCRRELLNPVMAHRTITDIAFSWGFQNSTHFSRRFKDEFGLSPHEFRNEACSTARGGRRMALGSAPPATIGLRSLLPGTVQRGSRSNSHPDP